MIKESIWNNNLVDRLKDLYLNKNMTAVDIGNELGFSKNAIIGKIHRLKLNVLKENYFKEKENKPKVKITKKSKEENIFTIETNNIKSVINISKKNNDGLENLQNLNKKIKTTPAIHNKNNLLNEEIDKQGSIYNDLNIVNQGVFQLDSKSSSLIGKYKLADIEYNMCVWPFGDEDFLFCGAKTLANRSYCQEHLDLVYFVTKKISKKKYTSIEDEEEIEEADEFDEIE